MNKLPAFTKQFSSISGIQLSRIDVNEDYLKKWNSSHYDGFVLITKDETPLRTTLYRVGGIGGLPKAGEDYFMILKYVEAFYEDHITTDPKRKPHLEGRWCILDKEGNEKVEFNQFSSPYLAGGQIYSIDSNYHNIETGESYGRAYTSMRSEEFVFLDTNNGVLRINKKDGTKKLYKK